MRALASQPAATATSAVKAMASRLPLMPFLLAGVAGTTRYMQDDGLHPNAGGCRLVAANVLKTLEPLLAKR